MSKSVQLLSHTVKFSVKMEEKKIFADHEVFEEIEDASRKSYIKALQDLKNFTNGHNFCIFYYYICLISLVLAV